MDKIYKNIGLVGSSQIKWFPTELLKQQGLRPIKLSHKPTNTQDLIKSGKLEKVVQDIIENHHQLDAVFLFIGANDIHRKCSPRRIINNIISIANEFANIGVEPIIMPIINREKPWGMNEDHFNTIRNSINRGLRNFYQRRGKFLRVMNINNLTLKSDGVHLTYSSYKHLSRSIAHQMRQLTISNLRTTGRHRLNNSEYSVQYFYQ